MQACKGDYSNFGQSILKRLTCKDHVAVTAFGVVNVCWGGGGGETHCFYDSQYRITHLHLIAQYLQLAAMRQKFVVSSLPTAENQCFLQKTM